MTALLSAFAFLTRIPVPAQVHTRPKAMENAAAWFPLVGLALGCIYAGVAWVSLHFIPAGVAAVLVILCDAILTGALHLDGLADMADGFGGGRTRDDVLRIMRDHAVGTYGAVALILVLLLKAVCLSNVLDSAGGWWIVLTAPALSRWAILLLVRLGPYARPDFDAGTGALSRSITPVHLAIGSATCLLLVPFIGPKRVLLCWLVAAATTACMAQISRRRIGGITGDVLGANTVLAEAAQYFVALLMVHP